jgi:hypothetical protein
MTLENPEALLLEAKERYTDREDLIWIEKIEKWCKGFDFDGTWIFSSVNNLDLFKNAKHLCNFIQWCCKNNNFDLHQSCTIMIFKSVYNSFNSNYKNSVDPPQELNAKEEKIVDEQNDFDDFEPDDSSISLKLSDLENTLQELDQSETLDQIIEEIEWIRNNESTISKDISSIQQLLDGLNEVPEDTNETVSYLASKADLDKSADKIIRTIGKEITNAIEKSFQSDRDDLCVRFRNWWRDFKLKDCFAMFGMIVLLIVFWFGIHAISGLI